eukprot:7964111-Pyramimonas_sp.AAC.1
MTGASPLWSDRLRSSGPSSGPCAARPRRSPLQTLPLTGLLTLVSLLLVLSPWSASQAWRSHCASFNKVNIGADDYTIEGGPTSKRYNFRFKGSAAYASRKVSQALGALKKDDGDWMRFSTLDITNKRVEVFLSGDKNACQTKRELACKQIRRILERSHGDLRFFTDTQKGEISSQWKALVKVTFQHGDAVPCVEYSTANLQHLGIDKDALVAATNAEFNAAGAVE